MEGKGKRASPVITGRRCRRRLGVFEGSDRENEEDLEYSDSGVVGT
jgi:hypothetical protein